MSTTYKTTCPHCGASFQITSEQLSLRDGRARCGNCSQIFQANNFLSELSSNSQPNQTNTNNSQLAQNSAQPAPALGDDFNDLFNDDSLKRKTGETQEVLIPEDALIDDNIVIDDNTDSQTTNDSLGMGSLGDELSAEFNNTQGNFSAITDNQIADEPDKKMTEDQWIESLLSEDTASDSGVSYASREPTDNDQPEDLISFLEDIGANTAQFSAIEPHQLTQEMTSTGHQTVNGSDTSNVNDIQHKTKMVRTEQSTNILKNVSYYVLWGFLSLLLLATLAGQYFYFNFDTLARDTQQRPQLEKVCGIVGCELPMMDRDKVGITQTNHFQDSGNPNWTRIKFVLTNDADKPMLLPNLKVSFTKKGKLTAENIIQPSDYLGSSYKRLPRSQPIDGEILVKTPNKSFDKYSISPLY